MLQVDPHNITDLIRLAILEDVGDGDHSSLSCVPTTGNYHARMLVKENGIVAGVEIAKIVFAEVDPNLQVEVFINDGSPITKGEIILTVSGNAQSILKAERLALNIMQRMSGIATHTRKMVDLIGDLPTKLLDTRKTTPNFRVFEKLATVIGGAKNHRMGLYDMIMLKDNHIDYAGGIVPAIQQTNAYLKETGRQLKIEVETRNLEEVEQVLSIGQVDFIMLDNFSLEDMKEAVKRINKRFLTEASGNITDQTIRSVAETGVDFISSGALTHQIKSLDLSLKAVMI